MTRTRDERGRRIIGNPQRGCPLCGAPAVSTVATDGKSVSFHAPTSCCPERRRRTREYGDKPRKIYE